MKYEANSDEKVVRALVLCAGSGSRTGLAYNKMLHLFGQKTVLETTLEAVLCSGVDSVLLAVAPRDENSVRELIAPYENVSVCTGGKTRTESVRNGLESLAKCDIVVIHDGARPYVTGDMIAASVKSAVETGSGIAAVPVTDTIKSTDENGKTVTLERSKLLAVQTPQTFRYDEILSAYRSFKGTLTDDSAVYEAAGYAPSFISGSPDNIKITTASDHFAHDRSDKTGIGFDVHELKENRKLILGGVEIPYEKGLYGHSDADVLVHAVTDGVLSAAGLPDIGVLFPDDDPAYEGANSVELLKKVREEAAENGYTAANVSAVVMAQRPKLAGYIPLMRENIAAALGLTAENVNVSATTTEHLGIIGEGKGMAASAIVNMKKQG